MFLRKYRLLKPQVPPESTDYTFLCLFKNKSVANNSKFLQCIAVATEWKREEEEQICIIVYGLTNIQTFVINSIQWKIFFTFVTPMKSPYMLSSVKLYKLKQTVSRLSGNQKQELEQEPPPGSVKVTQHRNSAWSVFTSVLKCKLSTLEALWEN